MPILPADVARALCLLNLNGFKLHDFACTDHGNWAAIVIVDNAPCVVVKSEGHAPFSRMAGWDLAHLMVGMVRNS